MKSHPIVAGLAALLLASPLLAAEHRHPGRGHDMHGHDMHGHDMHGRDMHGRDMHGHGARGRGKLHHPIYGAQLHAYDAVRAALAADDVAAAREAAKVLAASRWHGRMGASPGARTVVSHARAVSGAKDIAAARRAFGSLSRAFIGLIAASRAGGPGLQTWKCPMVRSGYGKWLQASGTKANPYMGKRMSGCGMKSRLAP